VHPRTIMCPTALDPASLLRRAPTLLCASCPQTPPPCSGGLRCRHVSHGSGPRLPAREGSGAAMFPTALDPASLLRRASVLPRVARLLTPPSCSAGLWCCYVSHGSRPHLPAREGSSAATCPTALNPASLLGGGRGLWTPPPCLGGLQCCHVPMAMDPTSLLRWGRGGSDVITCPMSLRGPRALRIKS
jgi:hypothetical protein